MIITDNDQTLLTEFRAHFTIERHGATSPTMPLQLSIFYYVNFWEDILGKMSLLNSCQIASKKVCKFLKIEEKTENFKN